MRYINLLITLLLTTTIFSHTNSKKYLDSLPNTIENQFVKTYKKSGSYQVYKVIKKTSFLKLQENIIDSVKALKKDIAEKQNVINTHEKTITELNNKIEGLNNNLNTAIGKEDKIAFIGIQLTKTSYNTIVWGIILGLLVGLFFFIFQFKNSLSATKKAKKDLSEVEEEFELHRKKSIEREQKLRRQLQDEINKQRGI